MYLRKGYEFTGWNTKRDGSGTSYVDKATILNLADVDGSTVTLYAQWKTITYTINYQLNGGVNSGANPTTYNITTPTNGGTITLYAQWKMNYISKKKTTVYVGSSEILELTGTNIKSAKSSNKKIATVTSKGKVTAKKAGKAIITLKGTDGRTYKCTVTVKNPIINAKKKTLKVGKKFTLKLTGTTIKSARSSSKKVATVTSKGIVTAKSKGKATITLKGKDKKSYKCVITVK